MSSGNLMGLIGVMVLGIIFLVFLWKDGKGSHQRTDAREAKKSEDTARDPYALDKDQQAADLQVGQQDEVKHPNRLAPDQHYR